MIIIIDLCGNDEDVCIADEHASNDDDNDQRIIEEDLELEIVPIVIVPTP